MLVNALVQLLFSELARYNGYYGKTTISKLNNNPGLIAIKKGYKIRQFGYLQFPSPRIGAEVFKNKIRKAIREDWSIYQVAKQNKNAALGIVRLLAKRRIKADIHTRLSSLLDV